MNTTNITLGELIKNIADLPLNQVMQMTVADILHRVLPKETNTKYHIYSDWLLEHFAIDARLDPGCFIPASVLAIKDVAVISDPYKHPTSLLGFVNTCFGQVKFTKKAGDEGYTVTLPGVLIGYPGTDSVKTQFMSEDVMREFFCGLDEKIQKHKAADAAIKATPVEVAPKMTTKKERDQLMFASMRISDEGHFDKLLGISKQLSSMQEIGALSEGELGTFNKFPPRSTLVSKSIVMRRSDRYEFLDKSVTSGYSEFYTGTLKDGVEKSLTMKQVDYNSGTTAFEIFQQNTQATLDHQTFGMSDDWLRNAIEQPFQSGEGVVREFLNLWTSNSQTKPLNAEEYKFGVELNTAHMTMPTVAEDGEHASSEPAAPTEKEMPTPVEAKPAEERVWGNALHHRLFTNEKKEELKEEAQSSDMFVTGESKEPAQDFTQHLREMAGTPAVGISITEEDTHNPEVIAQQYSVAVDEVEKQYQHFVLSMSNMPNDKIALSFLPFDLCNIFQRVSKKMQAVQQHAPEIVPVLTPGVWSKYIDIGKKELGLFFHSLNKQYSICCGNWGNGSELYIQIETAGQSPVIIRPGNIEPVMFVKMFFGGMYQVSAATDDVVDFERLAKWLDDLYYARFQK